MDEEKIQELARQLLAQVLKETLKETHGDLFSFRKLSIKVAKELVNFDKQLDDVRDIKTVRHMVNSLFKKNGKS